MPGQEYGHAITDVLFGDVVPSAKLPLTLPNKENEMQLSKEQWPGVNLKATYSEKLLVGYRWYDAHKVEPAFPFGHGLSYATFEYSNIQIAKGQVSVDIKNTGKVKAAEVAQLYLGFPA